MSKEEPQAQKTRAQQSPAPQGNFPTPGSVSGKSDGTCPNFSSDVKTMQGRHKGHADPDVLQGKEGSFVSTEE